VIVVVADTPPLNYLIQVNCGHVLPALYERIFAPRLLMASTPRSRWICDVVVTFILGYEQGDADLAWPICQSRRAGV
jgi:hypothetical protein